MTIRDDIKVQFDTHNAGESKKPEAERRPFDIEVFWMNGTQSVLRVDSFPEGYYGFFAAFQMPSQVSKDFGKFQKRPWTVNPDHIQRFRKVG